MRISVAGLEPLEGKGMEARFAVQPENPEPWRLVPLDYDGVALDLDLRGMSFANGVSDLSRARFPALAKRSSLFR